MPESDYEFPVHNPGIEPVAESHFESCPAREHKKHVDSHEIAYRASNSDTFAEAVCEYCELKIAVWDTTDDLLDHDSEISAVDICPHCDDIIILGYPTITCKPCTKYDDQLWHNECLLKNLGFTYIHESAESLEHDSSRPFSVAANDEFQYWQVIETEICGTTYEWTVWVHPKGLSYPLKRGFPTRADLTPEQRAELLKRVQQSANGIAPHKELISPPYKYILLDTKPKRAPDFWLCQCGTIVRINDENNAVDFSTECSLCGNQQWLTQGRPLDLNSLTDETLHGFNLLTDRESRAYLLSLFHDTTEIASIMDIAESEVTTHINHAEEKIEQAHALSTISTGLESTFS